MGQLGVGGTEQQVVLLALALRQRGVDVRVAALYAGGPREQELAAADVPVWIGGVPRKWQVWKLAVSLVRFVLLMRRTQPDVVHAFLFHAYVLVGPLGRLARVPVLVAGRRSLGRFLDDSPFLRLLERLTTPSYDALVANAQAVADDTLARERVPASRVHVIPNALIPHQHTSSPRTAWGDPPVVLCVANLIAYKGHRHLLTAAEQLAARGRPLRLVLAGEGPERRTLTEQARRGGIQVSLLGQRSDVERLLSEADLFALPSLEEGMSNALMEAMAAGLPIVATDVGGNAEVLGDAGVLCRPGDPADLAAALERLLVDEAAARAVGRSARQRAEESFGVQALVDAHLALYARLIKECTCAA